MRSRCCSCSARGFADPTRVAILLGLLDGERRVTDLVEEVGGSQSNVSGHLACLRDCGLVIDRPAERRQVFYRLAGAEVAELLEVVSGERLWSRCDRSRFGLAMSTTS